MCLMCLIIFYIIALIKACEMCSVNIVQPHQWLCENGTMSKLK